ncbi:unnamed protein product [Rotaria sp. Silwood2]|nr:unnamed protein product [Rotaria sp. Silwood2]
MGYKSFTVKRKPLRKPTQIKQRLKFAKEHKHWLDEWNNVMWSDEAHFEVLNRKNGTYIRRLQLEINQPFNLILRVQGGDEEQPFASKTSDKVLGNYLEYLKELDRDDFQCNVEWNDMEERFEVKKRSMEFMATFLNCGIIIEFSDSVNHEGPRKITNHLLMMMKLGAKLPSLLVYDAAFQLQKFWNYRFNTEHMKKNQYTQRLMEMKLVTARFHNTVHMGQLSEQTFPYLTNFKLALRSFSYPTSTLLTILLFHLKTCDKLNQDSSQQCLIIGTILEHIIQDQRSYQSYCIFETLFIGEKNDEDESQLDDEYVDISDHENNNI